jgi:hypothetical protein
MRRTVRSGATVLVLAAVLTGAFLLLRREPPPAPEFPPASSTPSVFGAADQTAPPGAIGRVAVVPFVEPESRPADSRPFDSRPAPESLPTTGVRGRITSPRVRLNSASDPEPVFGVDPRRCWVIPSRVNLSIPGNIIVEPKAEVRPRTSAGDFVVALTPGLWCLAARQDSDALVEFWNAHLKVEEGRFIDLGDVHFSETVTQARVVDPSGSPLAGFPLLIDDNRIAHLDGRSVPLEAIAFSSTDRDGRVRCAFSRYSGPHAADRSGPVFEVRWMAPADPIIERTVLVGSATELVVEPRANGSEGVTVQFSVGIRPGQHFSVYGEGLGYDIAYPPDLVEPDGRRSIGLGLKPGRFVVECRDGANVSRETIVVGADASQGRPIRIEPQWTPGRTLYGDVRGPVRRLLPTGGTFEVTAGGVDADGYFELHGLPLESLTIKVGDRVVTVPAGTDPRVELPK